MAAIINPTPMLENVSNAYLNNGPMGIVAVTFALAFALVLYLLLKKDTTQQKTSDSLDKLADALEALANQSASASSKFDSLFTLQQKYIEQERQAVRDCYNVLGKNQSKIMLKLGINNV